MKPRVEALRLAECRQVAPGEEQRLLRRILRAMWIAKDPVGDGVAAVDVGRSERGERLMIALLRPFDEVELHPMPSVRRPHGRVTDYGAGLSRNVHVTSGQACWR
jgi:hypothetical protein